MSDEALARWVATMPPPDNYPQPVYSAMLLLLGYVANRTTGAPPAVEAAD